MKLSNLLLSSMLLSNIAAAEIYKWKDSDGSVRYSDVPPPSNVKQEAMFGKKVNQPAGFAATPEVKGDANVEISKDQTITQKTKMAIDKATPDKLSNKALSNKETRKGKGVTGEQAQDENQIDLKVKQENCKTAKANLAIYNHGGRISKINEKGEKYFLSNADISQAKVDAQSKVDEYCQ